MHTTSNPVHNRNSNLEENHVSLWFIPTHRVGVEYPRWNTVFFEMYSLRQQERKEKTQRVFSDTAQDFVVAGFSRQERDAVCLKTL